MENNDGLIINAELIRDELADQVANGVPEAQERLDIINTLDDESINSAIINPSNDYFWELFDQLLGMAIDEAEQLAREVM